ncbi:hypothetical protein ACOYW6_08170 [Parablastomonas sp. CN1-191]|uniref:hypothetical protein n=1 Tax=Parablastomonas sp. CN1-191 TaxID=3400908 RepID=UPI003BF8FBE7
MKKYLIAVVLTIATPAVAHAQAASAPAAKMDCCEKMKAAGKDCCADMAGMHHSKMDHSKMGNGAQPAPQPSPSPTDRH